MTHSHYDHVDNLPKIVDKYSPEVYAYRPENLPVKASKISEGEEILLGGLEFEVFHTPGHKDDSICLYSEKKFCSPEIYCFLTAASAEPI